MKLGLSLSIIWPLVKRDYALQYAGSFLGILWILLQNTTLILVYAFVFLFLNWKDATNQQEYTNYIFSGLLFWLPLQEFLIRGTGILSDNRQLIKRSNLGMDIFLWIPYLQFLIHIVITAIPIIPMMAYYNQLNWKGLIWSYIWLAFTGLYILMFLSYLSRLNIILKDISPMVRLVSQILFWSLPILYYSQGTLQVIHSWNPLMVPLDVFRSFILLGYEKTANWYTFLPYLIFSILVFWGSRYKFHRVVADHL